MHNSEISKRLGAEWKASSSPSRRSGRSSTRRSACAPCMKELTTSTGRGAAQDAAQEGQVRLPRALRPGRRGRRRAPGAQGGRRAARERGQRRPGARSLLANPEKAAAAAAAPRRASSSRSRRPPPPPRPRPPPKAYSLLDLGSKMAEISSSSSGLPYASSLGYPTAGAGAFHGAAAAAAAAAAAGGAHSHPSPGNPEHDPIPNCSAWPSPGLQPPPPTSCCRAWASPS